MISGSSRPSYTKIWIALILVVGIGSYAWGRYAATSPLLAKAPSSQQPTTYTVKGLGSKAPSTVSRNIDFDQFWELWDMLKTRYHSQPVDERNMFYGAMQGLAASLGDPYTVYFEPQVATEFKDALSGKFDGIGAEIGVKNDQLQIIAPLPDTPAARAGLQAGDALLSINGTSTEVMSVEQAVTLIRGKKGTSVILTIGRIKTVRDVGGKEKRELERKDMTIVRDTIIVKSVRTKFLSSGVAVIEMTSFNTDTTEEFRHAVDEVLNKNSKGVVLDLRNDPGGFLDRATAVAGEWVGDQVVVTERRQGKIVDEYHGTGRGKLKGIPTVILINEGTASAAEIVAGALQDYGLATLVGTKTFGKGSVQDFEQFKDGSAVKITVAEWLTPKGRFINNVGITPDIVIERTEEDYHAERDPQLDKALELILNSEVGGATTTRQ